MTHRRVDYDREAAVQDMRDGYRDDPGRGVWLERQLYRDSFSRFPDWVTPFARIAWRKGKRPRVAGEGTLEPLPPASVTRH